MKKSQATLQEIKLVGISVRTSNANEMNPEVAKIGATLGKYFENNVAEQIPNRKITGTTYCVYTEYDSDEHGPYTYFVGEEVTSFDKASDNLQMLTIPAQRYAKFTAGPGQKVQTCINAWKQIWQMTEQDFGGKRTYIADFELYDQRSQDAKNTVLDIFIGIE